jgi:Vitamin K epoxide reductase family
MRKLTPSQLSRELRLGTSSALKNRRWIVGLSFLGAALGGIVSLYQMGMVRRLPSLPGELFDANKVDASDYAYKRMQAPDGPLMISTYAMTACLAAAGGENRAEDAPIIPVAAAAKAAYDVSTCLKLAREEWRTNHAFCEYCQLATLASIATLVLTLPEAMRAIPRLLR